MIRTEKGQTLIQGSQAEVNADLSSLIHSAFIAFQRRMSAEEAEKTIRKAVEDGLKAPQDDEEINIVDIFADALEDILKIIRESKGDK